MTTTNAIIAKTYHARSAILSFREDGYFNMTHAAKVFGKRLDNFKALPSTTEYIRALALTLKISDKDVMQAKRGSGLNPETGTWAHPKLAVFFARWLDTKFAMWCDAAIDDILKGNQKLQMVNKAESAVEALPADVKAAGAAWQAEMQAAMQELQSTVEAQTAELTEAKALLKGFMLKQEGDAKNAEYMSIDC